LKKFAMASMTTIGVSALGVAVLLPGNRPVTMDVFQAAAIVESNTTLGFADSDLYGMTPQQIDAALDQMQAMGVNNVRIMIPWAGVEYYPGYYNWSTVDYMVNAADSRGMGVLGVLNSTPFWAVTPGTPPLSGRPADPAQYGAFAGLVAERYAGKVGAYEIWNEPNAYIFYAPEPDPAGYTDLLKAAYPQIKAADPNAIVVGGVTGAVIDWENLTMNPVTFVNGIYQAGGGDYFDALSYHPYQYTMPFSTGGWHPDSPINQLAAMHDVRVANGDAEKLIWASEYGEPSNVAGEANQAAYLQDMITTWRTLGYTGPTFVWSLQDRNTGSGDPEDNFGVIRTDGTWKPAAYTIQQLATQPQPASLARMSFVAPEAVPVAGALDPASLPAPQTPMGAAMTVAQTSVDAGVAVASSVVSLNPIAVAATTLAAANEVAATTLQQANAAVAGMAPPSMTTIDQLRSVDLADVPADTPTQSVDTPKKRVADAPNRAADTKTRSSDGHDRTADAPGTHRRDGNR
jgi:hypothetical protein